MASSHVNLRPLQSFEPDPYATLGLDRRCTFAQIRTAYLLLAKRHHPDVNPESADAMARTQQINAAYEILSDPARREAYDLDRATADEILGLLQTLNREQGKTIVMVTHDPKAAEYASHQLYLDKGQLVNQTTKAVA